jgi:hypothetical protein
MLRLRQRNFNQGSIANAAIYSARFSCRQDVDRAPHGKSPDDVKPYGNNFPVASRMLPKPRRGEAVPLEIPIIIG